MMTYDRMISFKYTKETILFCREELNWNVSFLSLSTTHMCHIQWMFNRALELSQVCQAPSFHINAKAV